MRKIALVFSLLMVVSKTQAVNLVLSSPTNVPAANLCAGSVNDTIAHFQIVSSASGTTPVLTDIDFTSAGTYLAADVTNFRLWINSSNNSFAAASQIATVTAALGSGLHTFSFTQNLPPGSGTTYHFWITVTLSPGNLGNRNLSIQPIVDTDFTFSTTATSFTGATNTGGLQTLKTLPVATFSYTGTPYCNNEPDPSPAFSGGGVGGTFTSTAGLVINSTTGIVDLSASTPGSYIVTNTIAASGGCGQVTATSPIQITQLPVATFSYTTTPYCSNGVDPSPTFIGAGVGGTFTSTAGLVINSTTGVVDLSASTPGNYTVTNTIAASGGCGQVTATSPIQITLGQSGGFNYANTPYCSNGVDPSPTFIGAGVGGTFTSTAGLVINSTTGIVDLSASTPGSYIVTNTIAASGGCGQVTATSPIQITQLPVATFSYTTTPYCSNGVDPSPTFIGAGVGGTFTSTAGLVINSTTGVVDLSASTPGNYTVTNTIAASGGCGQVTATSPIQITLGQSGGFNYANTPYCSNGVDPSPTFIGAGVGGTFTSTAGLVINSTTGIVDLSASTPGSYIVTNTIAASGGCGQVTATSPIQITQLPVATFSYTTTPYCSNETDPSPTFSGAGVGGTFTSTAGLVINSTTGVVDLSASTPGNYTVTNTIAASGGCGQVTGTSSITINSLPNPRIDGDSIICNGSNAPLLKAIDAAQHTGNTFLWSNGITVSTNTPTGISVGLNLVSVTITDGNLCAKSVTDSVYVIKKPTVNVTSDFVKCPGDTSFQINFSGTNLENETFNWSRTAASIGLSPTSGANTVPQFICTNNGTSVIFSDFTVRPVNSFPTTSSTETCPGDSDVFRITINPRPTLSSPSTKTICSGDSVNYQIQTSFTSGVNVSWTTPPVPGITGASDSSGTFIPDVLFNSNSTSANQLYNFLISFTNLGVTCKSNSSLNVKVNLAPSPPVVTSFPGITLPTSLCAGSNNTSFSAGLPGVANTTYTWSSNNSNVTFGDDSISNTVISFGNSAIAYDASITVTATLPPSFGGCESNESFIVHIEPSSNAASNAKIVAKQPGNLLIYLDNTDSTYQWGFDSASNNSPSFINGQIFQVFVPESKFITADNALDTINFNYWVLVSKGECQNKIYYNGPFSENRINDPLPVPDEITSTIIPNPNNGNFEFNLSGKIYGAVDLRILNSIGQLVSLTRYEKTVPSQNFTLRLPRLNQGMYFIKVSDVYGERLVSKLLIR